ncbi:MAG: efflux RND transporter periplasmic adaptor subunit [Amylibacter sp.]|nr:efflux RND transporter periplasmic adaptor subunit [Amylibacter sp.]
MKCISNFTSVIMALMLFSTPVFAQDSVATVIVEKVVTAEISDTTPLIARLVATVEANIATRRDGVVEQVLFQVGDAVIKGQELVRIDDQLVDIQLKNAHAALQSAQAGIKIATARVTLTQNAFERQSGLLGSVAFSKARFDDLQQEAAQATGELSRALAQVAIGQAALERAKYDRKHSVIRAPFDGVVITRNVQPGQYISFGGSVAMLLDMNGLEIEADVPVSLLQGLKVGRALVVNLHNGTRAVATVRTVLPTETLSTRTRPVRLSVDLSDVEPYLIANGKTVTVLVPVSAVRKVVIVPKDALVQGLNGGWMVFVAKDGKAAPRPVTIGQASAGGLEVLSGLIAGDYVVIRGNERLRPDQAINPQDTDGNAILAAKPAKSAG